MKCSSGYDFAKGEGVGRNRFQDRSMKERWEDFLKSEKRLKFPTVLIKILLHAFLPWVPLDCP